MSRFVGHALRLRWCGVALGVAVVAMALPVQASAGRSKDIAMALPVRASAGTSMQSAMALPSAGRSSRSSKLVYLATGTAKKVAGLKLLLSAAPAQTIGSTKVPSSVTAYLLKRTESDIYTFNKGITYAAQSNLSSAHVSGTFALHRGSIKMKFHATRAATKVPVPKGCTGKPGKKRKGVLKGSFLLKADRLGKLRVRSVRAQLEIFPSVSCPFSPHFVQVSAGRRTSSKGLDVYATKAANRVTEALAVTRFGSGYSFDYSVLVAGLPSSDYTFSGDLSRAKVTWASPLHGSATYKGDPEKGGFSTGTLKGTLTWHFASIGTVKPFAKGPLAGGQLRR